MTDRHTCAAWNGAVGLVFAYSQAPPTDRFVLAAIAQHAGPDGVARPGKDRLAAITGLDVSTVRRCIARLERLGELVVERHQGHPSRYLVVLTDPAPRLPRGGAAPPELPRTHQ